MNQIRKRKYIERHDITVTTILIDQNKFKKYKKVKTRFTQSS